MTLAFRFAVAARTAADDADALPDGVVCAVAQPDATSSVAAAQATRVDGERMTTSSDQGCVLCTGNFDRSARGACAKMSAETGRRQMLCDRGHEATTTRERPPEFRGPSIDPFTFRSRSGLPPHLRGLVVRTLTRDRRAVVRKVERLLRLRILEPIRDRRDRSFRTDLQIRNSSSPLVRPRLGALRVERDPLLQADLLQPVRRVVHDRGLRQ